ncbi:MAG: RHS repeat-associated core domain-containing protein [Kofleriaceae bacterium]
MRRLLRWLAAGSFALGATTAIAGPTPDGSFVHRIPIPVPHGAGVATPNLALVYNSSSASGYAGRGFTLEGVPAIHRINHAQPIRYAATDEVAGPHGRLFPVGGDMYHGASEDFAVYRPSGSCGTGPCSWTMQDRQGNTWSFGTTEDSRIEGVGKAGSVRVWALARFQDRHGNAYDVTYDEDTTGGDYYPVRIRWGSAKFRTVDFHWEARPDVLATYDQGARVVMDRRLHDVEVYSGGGTVRKLTLNYNAEGRLASLDEAGDDGVSMLPRQTFTWADNRPFRFGPGSIYGTAGTPSQFPPLEGTPAPNDPKDDVLPGDFDGDGLQDLFTHLGDKLFVRHAKRTSAVPTWDLVATDMISGRWGERPLTAVGDFNGDGRDDVLSLRPCSDVCTIGGIGYTPAMMYYGRVGALTSQVAEVMYTHTASWNRSGFFWAADFDGDGRADLATRTGNDVMVALSTGDGFARPTVWSGPSTWGVREATYIVDYDGDGRADILTTRDRHIYVMRSTGTGFTLLDLFWNVNATNLSSDRMWVGDFNGDGKTDITARQSLGGGLATMFVCLSTGTAFDCTESTTPDSFGRKNFAADFDGDGRTDLLSVGIPLGHVDAQGITATAMLRKLGPSGYTHDYFGFLGIVDPGSGNIAGSSLVTVGDADGNGAPDVIQVNPSRNGSIHVTLFDTRLQRLTTIANGLGGELGLAWTPQRQSPHTIRYDPSCGGTSTLPDCGIPDRSGRPLLTRMSATTATVTQATSYDYSTSRIVSGPPGRAGFLGFRNVTATDDVTKVVTSDLYRQAKPFTGAVEQHRVYINGSDGVDQTSLPILEVWNDVPAQFICVELGCFAWPNPDPDAARQLRPARTRTKHYEFGRLLYEITSVPTYDAYGNPIAVTAWATDPANQQLYEERRLTSFINLTDPGNRAIGVPYEGKVCVDPACGEPASWTRTYFDDQPLGAIGTTHRMTRVETWAGGSTFAASTYGYDAWGNITRETSPDGQTRSFTYDAIYRSERTSEVDPIIGTTYFEPDDRWNLAKVATHESGHQLVLDFDAFGRPYRQTVLAAAIGPGTPYRSRVYAMPTGPGDLNVTQRCDYFDGDGDASTPFDAGLCTRTWVDGFGRKLVSETDAAGGPARVAIGYDAAGREATVSEPHHAGGPIFATVTTRDVLGRPTTVVRPDGAVETIRYNSVPLAPGAVTVDEGTDARGLTSQRHRDVRGRIVRVVEGIATTCIPLPDVPPCCIAAEDNGKRIVANGGPNDPPPDRLDPYPKDPPKLRCTTSTGIITDYVYDLYGRLVAIEGPDHITTTITYDAAGRRETVTHPSSGTTTWAYYTAPGVPSFGKVRTETRPAPNAAAGTVTSEYRYDAKGRLAERVDTDGTQVVMAYDETDVTNGLGRLTTARSTSNGFTVIERFGYDLDGNVVHARRRFETAAGVVLAEGDTETRFDALGRMVASVYPDGTTLEHHYDPASGQLDALAIDGSNHARFGGWDARGKLGVLELANGVTTRFDYTPEVGRLRSLETRSSTQTLLANQFTFDGDGNLERLDDSVQTALGMTYRYDALNRLRRAERADGVLFDYLFTDGGRMAVFSELDSTGQVVIRTRGIDAATGRLSDDGVDPLVYGAGGALLERAGRRYHYDDQARLSAIEEAGSVVQQNVYDHLHRRVLRIEQPSPDVEIRTYILGEHYEVTERLESGRVVERRGTRLIHGPDGGRLASLTKELSTTGPIDAMGAVAQRTPISTRPVRIAVFAISLLAAVLLGLGALRRRGPRRRWLAPVLAFAVFNAAACGGPAATSTATGALRGGSQTEGMGILYYTGNHVGSTALVTDEHGGEIVRLAYAPFGGTDPVHSGVLGAGGIDPSPATPPVGFTGARLDRDVTLYEMGRRFYDPTLGVFLTPDTVLPNPLSTQDQSIYRYAGNNPVIYNDPSGHFAWLIPAIVGFVVGAIYGGTNGKPWDLDAWKNFDVGGAALYGVIGFVAGFAGTAGGSVIGMPLGAALRGGIISTALAWHGGERDIDDLVRIFAAGAIEAGIYESGWWNESPKDFFYADVVSRTTVSLLQPGDGMQVGLGLFSVGVPNVDNVHVSWGRLIHLGVTHSTDDRAGTGFYKGWSWQRINKVGNLGVLTMSVDELVVAKLQYAADWIALRTASSPTDDNATTKWLLELGSVGAYMLLRLGLSTAAVKLVPGTYAAGRTAGQAIGNAALTTAYVTAYSVF